ncbi:lytic transglycosylase domain-containing protein [Agromyces flavus]|uniref:aggregation-promoting factor C-terminal-like domain-containing protein n=1 Tax=Agromyces flavus TaxID=589382 RepID=UPI0020A2BC21|nr:lytic transglycosylase domain-containing protein [Agromyces flavus]
MNVPRSSAPVRPAAMRRDDPAPRAREASRANVSSPARNRVAGPIKQAATVTFAFAASVSFLLVNIVDPYSGATASSTYTPVDRFGGQAVQEYAVDGDIAAASVAAEGYLVEKKPEPEPEPAGAGWAPPAIVPDPGSAQAYAAGAVAARGWPSTEFDCLVALWNRESGWRVNAYNPSGAYGIPQALPGSKMATAGADWETNAATQIEWGLGYISGRYGTPCGAWAHSEANGWY